MGGLLKGNFAMGGFYALWYFQAYALLFACLIDWLVGDPSWLPHPVRLMGKMIASLEAFLRRYLRSHLLLAGGILAACLVGFWLVVPAMFLWMLNKAVTGPGRVVLFLAEACLFSQLLAARDLCKESMPVARALLNGQQEEARQALSRIVGRETACLDEAGIIRAGVETVAENTSDGVIAPFFYMALFGAAGGYVYKAVNTMDSMVGYRNARYLLFGRAAARLDDAFNFIPARLTGLLLCLAACIHPRTDGYRAFRIFLRDRKNHESPNSAHGEAACAGALGIRLGGDAVYFGQLHKKALIGDGLRPACAQDIRTANELMFLAQALLMAVFALVLVLG